MFDIQNHVADEIRRIIENCIQHGQLKLAQQWMRAFGLSLEQFADAATVKVNELLEQGQWEPALKVIGAFALPLCQFQEAAAAKVYELLQQGQWDAGRQGIEAFGLPDYQFQEVAGAKVQELLQQGRWNAAVAGAERFQLWGLVHDYLADAIHSRGDESQCLNWVKKTDRRIRNGLATVLLQRYGDVESALAVAGSLGFSREQIEHNGALIERVEKINQALAQTEALPKDEDMRNLELFGYVHESGWILAPGFRDFRISESAKDATCVGRVVRFQLVVEQHPTAHRLVLNATNLEAV